MSFAYNDALDDNTTAATEPSSDTGTAVLERPKAQERRFAHYVSRDRIAESRLTGRPVVALCGKVWVPKRNPKDYPICPECKRIYEEMTK